jgi:hypothetical protein
VESVQPFSKPIRVPFGHEGQAVAITNVLIIHAKLVLNVERWYWYYTPGMSGVAAGWQGMGGLWNSIYADLAWVEASGLVQMRPVEPWEQNPPAWWYCVNMDGKTVVRPLRPEEPGD